MSTIPYHPVLDHEELRRALDSAPIEDLINALVRRAGRLLALGEAAYHEASHEENVGRVAELARRCATSARVSYDISQAVTALAPRGEMDREAAGYARVAGNFDRLAQLRLDLLRQREEAGVRA